MWLMRPLCDSDKGRFKETQILYILTNIISIKLRLSFQHVHLMQLIMLKIMSNEFKQATHNE